LVGTSTCVLMPTYGHGFGLISTGTEGGGVIGASKA